MKCTLRLIAVLSAAVSAWAAVGSRQTWDPTFRPAAKQAVVLPGGLNPDLHASVRTGSPYAGRMAADACGLDFENEVNWYTFEDGAWDASQAMLRILRLSAQPTDTAAGLPGYEGEPAVMVEDASGQLIEQEHPPPRLVFAYDPEVDGGVPTHHELAPCLRALLGAEALPSARSRRGDQSGLDIAVAAGDTWLTALMLLLGADPNTKDERGMGALHYAAHAGTPGPLRVLVGHPSTNLHLPIRGHGVDALMVAAQAGDGETLQTLLDAGADVRRGDKAGITALGKAAALGHTSIVRHLEGAGADIAAQDKNGATPLLAAIQQNSTTGVEVLLELGADLHAPIAPDGTTPLMFAVSLPAPLPVIRTLLGAGADPNAATLRGATSMSIAVRTCPSATVLALHKAGGSIDLSFGGKSLLTIASESGRAGGVAALLALGGDPNALADSKWETRQLHVAAMTGHLPTVKVLVKAGARLHDADRAKHTALHWAAYSGHARVAGWLLKKGLDANAVNSDKLTPLMLAAQQGHAGVVTALARGGANLDVREARRSRPPLLMAAGRGRIAAVNALLDAGADIDASDDRLWTALSLAAHANDVNTTVTLLERGASVRAFFPEDTGLLKEDVESDDLRMSTFAPGVGEVKEEDEDSHLCLSLTLRAAHWDSSPEGRKADERRLAEQEELLMDPEEAAVARKARLAKEREERKAKRRGKKKGKKKKKKSKSKGKKKKKKNAEQPKLKHPGTPGSEEDRPPTPWDVAVPVCLAEFGVPRETLRSVFQSICGFGGDISREATPACGINALRLPAAMAIVNPGGLPPRQAEGVAESLTAFAMRYFPNHQHSTPPVVMGSGEILDTRDMLNSLGVSIDSLQGKTGEEIQAILAAAQGRPSPAMTAASLPPPPADASTLGSFSMPAPQEEGEEEEEAVEADLSEEEEALAEAEALFG